MIRACVDANVLISFMLAPESKRPPSIIVRAAFAYEISLVISETTLEEVERSIRDKPWLRERIGVDRGRTFVAQFRRIADMLPEIDHTPESVVRDAGDNYLIAHIRKEQPDYLVSGDKDLLVMGEHAGVRIVSPARFVEILETDSPTMVSR